MPDAEIMRMTLPRSAALLGENALRHDGFTEVVDILLRRWTKDHKGVIPPRKSKYRRMTGSSPGAQTPFVRAMLSRADFRQEMIGAGWTPPDPSPDPATQP